LEESSDEESHNKKADMHHTGFGNSKKVKQSKPRGEEWFGVVQVFCGSRKWLVASEGKTWSLHENCQANVLTFFDDQGTAVKDLTLHLGSLRKIERGKRYPKMVIHKSIDQTANKTSQICVEFSERDDGSAFIERLKKFSPSIGDIIKEE
jgi:hypothetical protein